MPRRLLPLVAVMLACAAVPARAQDVPDPGSPIVLPGEQPGPAVTGPTGPTGPSGPVVPTPAPGDGGDDPLLPSEPVIPQFDKKPGMFLRSDGTVGVDSRVPARVRAVVRAANRIAKLPYKWGGGHGRWTDNGYDCSGSVSYALHGAGLLQYTMVSGQLGHLYGLAGRGRWISIFGNATHVWMTIGGIRYDTGGPHDDTSRWSPYWRTSNGFLIRHPAGL